MAQLRADIARSLGGRCAFVDGMVVDKTGDAHEHCGNCQIRCGSEFVGLVGMASLFRKHGEDGFELRWICPSCGVTTIQATTALASFNDSADVSSDPLCFKCRK